MTSLRAFLSHSSAQKDFVDAVARELGRQFCVFDKYTFRTGDDLHEAIRRGLTDSTIFVLFASREAGQSPWVQFELDEAEKLAVQQHIDRSLVFLLDSSISPSDLPLWLRKSLMSPADSPKAVAREIRDRLDSIYRSSQQPTFVGRSREKSEAERLLLPSDGSQPPRVFGLWGLSGIGRRALCDRIGRDLLQLTRLLPIKVESGDSVQDLCTKLAARFEVVSTSVELSGFIERIKGLSDEEAASLLGHYLGLAVKGKELPLLLDSGGLLDNDGRYASAVALAIKQADAVADTYLALVSERRPDGVVLASGATVPHIRVNQLSPDEIKRLLVAIGRASGPDLTAGDASDLAEYLGGYPPAAHYAMQLAREYGVSVILADKVRLVDFRARTFVRYLSQDARLSPESQSILAMLATYNPLPLPVIGTVLGMQPDETARHIVALINAALVWPGENGLYWLAAPVVEAVARVLSEVRTDHSRVFAALGHYLEEADPADRVLSLSQSLYRARRFSGAPDKVEWEAGFASDIIDLARRSYHARDFERAIAFGKEAVSLRPDDIDAREFLVRALIQEERYEEAVRENARLKELGALRDFYFLAGFLERHRGRHAEAVEHYNESIRRGRRGVAVHRELAQCHIAKKQLPKAREHIDIAQSLERDNRYVVDLKAQIAVAAGDEVVARQQLEILQSVDSEAHYKHRLSAVEMAFGSATQALAAATSAVGLSGPRPPFQMLSQLAKCQMEVGDLEDASATLGRLAALFPKRRQDIQRGLKCKWETASGNYGEALRVWDGLDDKAKPVHKALRAEALRGLLSSGQAGTKKAVFEAELLSLASELDGQKGWLALDWD